MKENVTEYSLLESGVEIRTEKHICKINIDENSRDFLECLG